MVNRLPREPLGYRSNSLDNRDRRVRFGQCSDRRICVQTGRLNLTSGEKRRCSGTGR